MDDKPWFILAFFMIVVGIPVIAGVIGDVYKRRLKLRERELELLGSETAEKAAQYASRVGELEQRVRVLERILTDGGVQTAAQIEALRDTPPIFAGTREKVQ
ncbi:hypothetical protein [Sphingomonas sp. LHG3406-1]|uniref:hypothetical protein n=1 Tax=Sphingomonas sp. LHG3406-1 TaxID=2804617 RepID=UPI0026084A97|nr:hypothetical protein [Sphingomonas sp. LHG3406-1]